MGELTKALTEFLTRLDQLPMTVKAGWLVWITVGGVLLQWRRVGRNTPVWLPPPAPRQIRRVDRPALLAPIPVSAAPVANAAEVSRQPEPKPSKRRRRSRHTTLSISPAAS